MLTARQTRQDKTNRQTDMPDRSLKYKLRTMEGAASEGGRKTRFNWTSFQRGKEIKELYSYARMHARIRSNKTSSHNKAISYSDSDC